MKDYKIVAAESTHALAEKVTQALREGWTCTGGVHSVTQGSSLSGQRTLYMQAVIRG